MNSSINLGDLYIIDFWSSDDLGARTTFYDYIDEEFEDDDFDCSMYCCYAVDENGRDLDERDSEDLSI